MANIKMSELNEQENRNDEDLLAIVDVNNNETKKIKAKTLAPQNVEIVLISDTEPTSGIHQGEMYYNTTTNKLYTYVGGGVYINEGEPKFGILYIIYSSQTIYTYNGTTLINIGGSGNYTELDGKPSINGNTLNGNKTNAELGIPNALNEYSESTTDTYSCNEVNNLIQDVYSTDEVKTNKVWIDGKPIYRKVFVNNYSQGLTTSSFATGLSNINEITYLRTTLIRSNDYEEPWYSSQSDWCRVFFRNSANTIEVRSPALGYQIIVKSIIEYTKTTD